MSRTTPSAPRPQPRRSAKAMEAAREAGIQGVLDDVRARCDVAGRMAADPVEFVHRFRELRDQELVALIASSLAFGNVKALRAKIEDALARLGPDVALAADDPARVRKALRGWKHRVYRDEDLAGLVVGARRVQRTHGSLGAALAGDLERTGDLRAALSAWVARIRTEAGLTRDGARRGASHILPDPEGGSAAKRLMLLLRWMIRPADGVDLGLWKISPALLLVPVDTHIHKLGRNLGLTDQKTISWKVAEEITARLRRFDPKDPVKYDFALCHMGMLQRCPSRRDEQLCDGCGIRSVCKHWSR